MELGKPGFRLLISFTFLFVIAYTVAAEKNVKVEKNLEPMEQQKRTVRNAEKKAEVAAIQVAVANAVDSLPRDKRGLWDDITDLAGDLVCKGICKIIPIPNLVCMPLCNAARTLYSLASKIPGIGKVLTTIFQTLAGALKPRTSLTSPTSCVCPFDYNPVCGQDGVTYPNRCTALCNNAGVDVLGPCGGTFPCVCPYIYRPVCGGNGQTYPNKCEANCKGTAVAYEGQCGKFGIRPRIGVLAGRSRGCTCPFIYWPVCSIDGTKYDNKCLLECAGGTYAWDYRLRDGSIRHCHKIGDFPYY